MAIVRLAAMRMNMALMVSLQNYFRATACLLRLVSNLHDFYHFLNFFASKELMPVVNNTMLTELTGISIAAITGCNVPCTAKYNPMILYKMEMIKLPAIIFF